MAVVIVPTENSTETNNETSLEPEVNHDSSQATTSIIRNFWTENQQNPELHLIQENIGLKFD